MANDNLKKLIDNYGRACVAFGTPAWESKAGEELAAALASHTGEAEPKAYLLTRPSGFAWPAMPKDLSPETRAVHEADGTRIDPLFLATPPAATPAAPGEVTAMKLVPCEPTVAMINAGQCGCMDNDVTASIYRLMLDAAPAALSNPAPIAAPAPITEADIHAAFCRGLLAGKPAPASEAVAWVLKFPGDGGRLCLSTVFDTESEAKEYASTCDSAEVIRLYAAPPQAGAGKDGAQ